MLIVRRDGFLVAIVCLIYLFTYLDARHAWTNGQPALAAFSPTAGDGLSGLHTKCSLADLNSSTFLDGLL